MRGPSEIATLCGKRRDVRALACIETAFRPDEEGERTPGRQGRGERGQRIGDRRVLVAEDEETIGRPIVEELFERHGFGDFRQGQNAALFGRFDRIGPHAGEIDTGRLGAMRHDRLQPAGAHFDGLLHHVIEPRMFQRREQVVEIAGALLRARLRFDPQDGGFPRRARKTGAPFAIAAVEDENGIALRQPQHVHEIIRLLARETEFAALLQRRIEKKAGCVEFVAGHGGLARGAAFT